MNARENYLTAARGGKPEYMPLFPRDANMFIPDYWDWRDPVTGADFCNVKWITDDFGSMPDPKWRAMEDISQWRETVQFPKLSQLDWEGMARRFEETKDPHKVTIGRLNTRGIFLIPINMMGWMDALCTICEEPEETAAFAAAITDFLVENLYYFGKYIKPDIVFSGDDFAANGGPFLAKDLFREIYVPLLKRISDAIHEIGALAEFHCCGNCGYLTQEVFDCGYDIIQLPEINEQLLLDKQRLGNKLVMTGGWDRRGPGLEPNAPEEAVRESVREAFRTWGRDGGLIFWDGGICGKDPDSVNKRRWVDEEADQFGATFYRRG